MAETSAPKKPLRFRNYRPADATLAPGAAATAAKDAEASNGGGAKKAAAAAASPAACKKGPAKPQQQQEGQPPAAGAGAAGAGKKSKKEEEEEEDVIKRELQKHLEEHGSEQLNVAPRKPNWDLKRDVAKKMEKLNRLTQKAIVEMLREKLAREAEEGSSEEEDDEEED